MKLFLSRTVSYSFEIAEYMKDMRIQAVTSETVIDHVDRSTRKTQIQAVTGEMEGERRDHANRSEKNLKQASPGRRRARVSPS